MDFGLPKMWKNLLEDAEFKKKAASVLSKLVKEFGTSAILVDLDGRVLLQKTVRSGVKYFCDRTHVNSNCQEIERSENRAIIMEAWRWGEAYISRCPFDIIRISVPILRNNQMVGGLILRPMLLRDPSGLASKIMEKYFDPKDPLFKNLKADYKKIPVWDENKMYQATSRMFELAESLSTPNLDLLRHVQEIQKQQAKIAEEIHQYKAVGKIQDQRLLNLISYDIEKELIRRVRLGDRTGAREILNKLLGIAVLQNSFRVDLLKAHILELVVVLTRAAVEEGGNLEAILGMKYNFIVELSSLEKQEEICFWIVRVLDRIIDNIYKTRNVYNYEILQKALKYIDENSSLPLTLEDVAQTVAISPFHFAHLIKKELGFTFVDYLTRVRIEKAKRLLRQTSQNITQIAFEVGYPDQSYFTKVFKRLEDTTPKLYRKAFLRRMTEKEEPALSERIKGR